MSEGPLAGIKVLDLSRILAGPYCSMLLADMGATVIKVEPPGTGDQTRQVGPFLDPVGMDKGTSGFFNSLNRNKKSLAIDVKSPEGRKILLDMVPHFDVVLENFRGGVMESYGLGYDVIRKLNPRLIYASIRGFGDTRGVGTTHPGRPSVDLIIQAVSGIMSITGSPEGDMYKVGPGIGDIFPGTLAAFGIVSALHWRNQSGEGQYIDMSMYDGMISLCERIIFQYSYTGTSPQPVGNAHPFNHPYSMYPAKDGFFVIAGINERFWTRICEAIGRPEIATDPRYATFADRAERHEEVNAMITEWSMQRSRDEVMRALLEHNVLAGPVNTAGDIFDDGEARKRQMLVDVEAYPGAQRKVTIAGVPIKMEKTPGTVRHRAPLLGEHTREVLSDFLGYEDQYVDDLVVKGAVAVDAAREE